MVCACRAPTASFPQHALCQQVRLVTFYATQSPRFFYGNALPYPPIQAPSLLGNPFDLLGDALRWFAFWQRRLPERGLSFGCSYF